MIYLDSNVIIRLVESDEVTRGNIRRALTERGLGLATSELSLIECRCRPMRLGDSSLLAIYERFCSARDLVLRAIDRAVVDRATELRANLGLKTPDAIHLATAEIAGADAFASGDREFLRVSGISLPLV